MKISEAAAASGCHLETIRYYERIGLMRPPHRTASGYRAYRPEEVDRLRFITRSRDLGFSLEEIGSLLHLAESARLPCEEVDAVARRHLQEVRTRLQDLRRMESELKRVIQSCEGGVRAQCTILETLRRPRASRQSGAADSA